MSEKLFNRPSEYFEERHCILTAREIAQQPASWRRLADSLESRKEEIRAFMDQVLSVEGLTILTAGAGSSAFIGEALKYVLAGELRLKTQNIHTTDIISAPEETLFDAPTLMISYARSGESPESMAAVKFAEKKIKNLWHIILVCDKNSTLAKTGYALPNALVLDQPPETCDQGFAMTSSVSCMALSTWCIFHYKEMEEYTGYVRMLADSAEEQMESLYESAQAIAGEQYRRLIWLGCGALKGLAREACVKSMELTDGYVHAGYDAATGFRHGPKTVVNDETMTVHFLSTREYTRQYDVDFLKEMIAEKKKNIIVSVKEASSEGCASGEDYAVVYKVPDAILKKSEMGAYIHGLIFSQLLSMNKSLEKHFNTDSPCEKGEVNRVVKGIIIYDF